MNFNGEQHLPFYYFNLTIVTIEARIIITPCLDQVDAF